MKPMRMGAVCPCLDIPVGTRLSMDINGFERKLTSAVVGYSRGRFVLVNLPAVPENNRDHLYQSLYPENAVTVRYLHDGSVAGFRCQVVKYVTFPYPLLFLSYPQRLEIFDLRKHKRAPCFSPVVLRRGDRESFGILTDLSMGGCRICVDGGGNGDGSGFKVDEELRLDCDFFGEEVLKDVVCVVKRTFCAPDKTELGLKFKQMHPIGADRIELYIDNVSRIAS